MEPAEVERYARHIVLREIGGPGQARLRRARVAVVGAGGLGAPLCLYLAGAGIGHITLIDDDSVSLSNLQRQVIFATSDIGQPKVLAAQATLAALNPGVSVQPVQARLTDEHATRLLAGHDLVLDGSDNFATRYLVNATCVTLRTPLLAAAMSQWEGQISLYSPASGAPCYACIFPEPPAPGLVPNCAEAGIVGALAGVMGSMMALEAVKFIAQAGGVGLAGRLNIYDGLWGEARSLTIARRADCPVCAGHGPETAAPTPSA
ncbi:MAG: HesA/MoeB/ThiF family protein [Paracoccaceae bacterium]